MPAWMYDKEGNRKPQYKGVKYKPKKDKKKTIEDAVTNMRISKKVSREDGKAREKAGAVA